MKSPLYIWCTYYGRPCMKSPVYMVYILWGDLVMKSPLYIWCTYYGETLYEEFSVYMVYQYYGETLYEESSVYMVYILWGDLV